MMSCDSCSQGRETVSKKKKKKKKSSKLKHGILLVYRQGASTTREFIQGGFPREGVGRGQWARRGVSGQGDKPGEMDQLLREGLCWFCDLWHKAFSDWILREWVA